MNKQTINNLAKTENNFLNLNDNVMKQLFKNPIKVIHVLAISSMLMAGSIAAHAQVKVGANPASITANSVLDVEGTSAQRTVILQNGNMGVNQTIPTNKLHVKDAANPVRFEGLQVSTNASDKTMVVDENGVLKKTNSSAPSAIVVYSLGIDPTVTRGGDGTVYDIINDVVMVNSIPGASYNAASNDVTIPAGTYSMTFSMSANINDATVTNTSNINSYFFQFPSITSASNDSRIHCNSPSVNGGTSSHGATMTYVAQYTGTTTVHFGLGWGQGGNVGSGKKIQIAGVQLSIVRIAD